jgi:hypothetical protein
VEDQAESLEAIESFQRYVDSDPDVGYSWSMADVLKSITQVFYDTDPRWGVISEEPAPIANLLFYYFGGATPSELAKSMDPSYTYSHVTFFCRNHKGENITRIIKRAQELGFSLAEIRELLALKANRTPTAGVEQNTPTFTPGSANFAVSAATARSTWLKPAERRATWRVPAEARRPSTTIGLNLQRTRA